MKMTVLQCAIFPCRGMDWAAVSEHVQRFVNSADPEGYLRGNPYTPHAAVYVEGIGDVSYLIYERGNQGFHLRGSDLFLINQWCYFTKDQRPQGATLRPSSVV